MCLVIHSLNMEPPLLTRKERELPLVGATLVAQTVKNLPVMQETQVQSQGWEDPLEKEMATHSREYHGQRNLASYSPWVHKESDTTERLKLTLLTGCFNGHWGSQG